MDNIIASEGQVLVCLDILTLHLGSPILGFEPSSWLHTRACTWPGLFYSFPGIPGPGNQGIHGKVFVMAKFLDAYQGIPGQALPGIPGHTWPGFCFGFIPG